MDKRRDLRDELGYIAPPNRKVRFFIFLFRSIILYLMPKIIFNFSYHLFLEPATATRAIESREEP